jgi:hypothetical protein
MPAVTIFQGSIYDRLGSYTPLMDIIVFAALHLHRHIFTRFVHNMKLTRLISSGQSHTASRHYASIDTILGKECSLGDRVRAQCRLAYSMAQNGSYAAAQTSLASLHSLVRGTLKLEQRIAAFARLIALLQAIRMYASLIPCAYVVLLALTMLSPIAPTSQPQTHTCHNYYP